MRGSATDRMPGAAEPVKSPAWRCICPYRAPNLESLFRLIARLGLPPEPEQALAALRSPALRRIDLGRVNGRPFLCACMVGVAALLARYREKHRQQPRWRRWPALFIQALRLWGRYPHLRLHLVADGKTRRLAPPLRFDIKARAIPVLVPAVASSSE